MLAFHHGTESKLFKWPNKSLIFFHLPPLMILPLINSIMLNPPIIIIRFLGAYVFPNKPSFHSTPCVFLGYHTNHHGYRCLNHDTQKIIIYRHVIFDETTFLYGSMTPDRAPSYSFLEHFDVPSDFGYIPPHVSTSINDIEPAIVNGPIHESEPTYDSAQPNLTPKQCSTSSLLANSEPTHSSNHSSTPSPKLGHPSLTSPQPLTRFKHLLLLWICPALAHLVWRRLISNSLPHWSLVLLLIRFVLPPHLPISW